MTKINNSERPRKDENNKKTYKLNIRLTADENALIINRLRHSGFKEKSAFIIHSIKNKGAASKPLISDINLFNILKTLIYNYHKTAVNINQAVKKTKFISR